QIVDVFLAVLVPDMRPAALADHHIVGEIAERPAGQNPLCRLDKGALDIALGFGCDCEAHRALSQVAAPALSDRARPRSRSGSLSYRPISEICIAQTRQPLNSALVGAVPWKTACYALRIADAERR